MIDDLVLFNILKFIANPMDFINMLIAITPPSDVIVKINYFKNTRDFQELLWMFNCGVLARFTFTSVNDYIMDDFMTICNYGPVYHYYIGDYMLSYHDDIIKNKFFTVICSTYFNVWISNLANEHSDGEEHYYSQINKVFGFEIEKLNLSPFSTDEEKLYVKTLDVKFDTLYDKYSNAFESGFNSGSKNMNLIKYIVSNEMIDKQVNKELFGVAPFVSKATGLTEKEDHYLTNKQTKKHSKYDNKKKEKLKQKQRSSPKLSRRREKYSNKINYFD
jgi:hypothetical protein